MTGNESAPTPTADVVNGSVGPTPYVTNGGPEELTLLVQPPDWVIPTIYILMILVVILAVYRYNQRGIDSETIAETMQNGSIAICAWLPASAAVRWTDWGYLPVVVIGGLGAVLGYFAGRLFTVNESDLNTGETA